MSGSFAARLAAAVFMFGAFATPALAQQAYCSCCGGLYTPAGSDWIGASRVYRGLCDRCTANGCVDCARSAERLRRIYDRLVSAQREEGQTVAQLAARGREIDYIRQRWADLRYLCLAMGHGDIGRLDPDRPDLPPSQGLRTEETKKRFQREAMRETAGLSAAPALPPELWDHLFDPDPLMRELVVRAAGAAGERVRRAQLFHRFYKDPPDPDYEKEVEPVFSDIPAADGKPRFVQATRDTARALNNSNAYADAYLKSFERYQGAERDGNKAAMALQQRAMTRLAFFAEHQARRAALAEHEAGKLRLQLLDERRAALAKEGRSWQDGWKSTRAKLETEGWPADVGAAMTAAGVSAEQSDAWLEAALALTADDIEKALAARREELDAAEATAKLLNEGRGERGWPEPAAIDLYEVLRYEAQLLHAEGSGKRAKLSADDPFSGK